MSKILLIGGAGYVGCVLAKELLSRGYDVRIVDRLYYGDEGLHSIRDQVELIIADMRTLEPTSLNGISGIINLGGLSNDPTADYNPAANHEMNTIAAYRLAEKCCNAGVSRYIFASSCSIYDRGVEDAENDLIQNEEAEVCPRTAYSESKYNAERFLLQMAGRDFCPVILRKGTIYGFSPRMRYDLVVNTFIKDALCKGVLTLHYGGEMWRPLIEIRDVAQAYVAALEAPEENVRGQIFNIASNNFRISELALRVRDALRIFGIHVDIQSLYSYKNVRSYRVSTEKSRQVLKLSPKITVEESVVHMVDNIRQFHYTDFNNPRYDNISWMKLLENAQRVIAVTGSVFGAQSVREMDAK